MLESFKKERKTLKTIAQDFSRKFPKVAGFLNLEKHKTADPQIEKLIESVAFLTGQLDNKMEGKINDLSSSLLELADPRWMTPLAPRSIVKFEMDISEANESQKAIVPEWNGFLY